MMNTQKVFVKERVTVAGDCITVCVNVDDIDHETSTWKAADYVTNALTRLGGADGTIFYGDELKFPASDFPWIT